jgi:hypothetical protein
MERHGTAWNASCAEAIADIGGIVSAAAEAGPDVASIGRVRRPFEDISDPHMYRPVTAGAPPHATSAEDHAWED